MFETRPPWTRDFRTGDTVSGFMLSDSVRVTSPPTQTPTHWVRGRRTGPATPNSHCRRWRVKVTGVLRGSPTDRSTRLSPWGGSRRLTPQKVRRSLQKGNGGVLSHSVSSRKLEERFHLSFSGCHPHRHL